MLSLFGARLVQLQGLDAPTYAAEAEQGRLRTVTLPAARGTITDRNGVALATTVAAVNITSDQTKVVDPAATARALAPVLKVDAAELQAKLTGDARFVYVAKTVAPAIWRTVRELDHPDPDIEGLPGIYAEQTSKRVYPAGQVGANVVGFVGAEGKGLGGIEYALDSTLAGRDGTATYELSAGGRRIPSGVDTERDAVPGTDVRLTIDRDIQYVAQQAIAKAVASTRSQSGTVIVYRPSTGDLLAVATAPTFDPNKPGAAPAEDRGNRPLTEVYEPGSTGKIITASALIEEGVIRPTTPITVPNRLTRADKTFKDFEDHPVQHLTYAGTIAKSSNIGTIRAAERLGDLKRLYPYLKKFGVGEPTGLGLPGEASGEVLKPGDWSATSGYTMTFGQGYSVNTVQMASAIATVANDGVRVAPRLVAATTGPDGTVRTRAGGQAHPGGEPADRAHRPADDGVGDPRGRHRAARRDPRLPGGRQDRHRAAVQPVVRLLQRLHDVVHRARPGRRPGRRRRGHPAGAEVRARRRRQRRAGLQAGRVLRTGDACGSRRRAVTRPGSGSPRADR